jgi:SAM-dependent methyltransferase
VVKLHELDPRGRFSDRATDYANYRPDYPDEAVRWIVEGLGVPSQLLAVDVGAGTGISSRRLAGHGLHVIAAEPNRAMREAAEAHSGIEWIESAAEDLALPDDIADLVTCFQAFHWFQAEEALREFSRVLKSQGRLAVVWNERDRSDGFTTDYGDLVRQISRDHPAERREQTIAPLFQSPRFDHVRHAEFPHVQRLSREGLIGRARSASYLPGEGEGLKQLMESLTRLHHRWADRAGEVALVYRTVVYLADPVVGDR